MAASPLHFSLFILLLLSHLISTTQSKSPDHADLVRSSCLHASYPKICVRSLSSSGGAAAAKTPRELAQLAVSVSLNRARKAEQFLSRISGDGRRERRAVRDCIEQMRDSIDELRQTMAVLRRLRRDRDFQWQMNNAETWMSAALSNTDTCLDGFREIGGRVRSNVRRKVTNVARVTSNALYLINVLDDSHGRKPAAP